MYNVASVSLGVNEDGRSEGQLMGVFARNNERATVGQLWWDESGAGGFQGDFNWLWGMDALYARTHPDEAKNIQVPCVIFDGRSEDFAEAVHLGEEK